MNCPHCQAPSWGQQLYCGQCGTALGKPCPSCFFTTWAADRFCRHCRHPFYQAVAPSPAQPVNAPPVPPALNALWQEAQTDDQSDLTRRHNLTQADIDKLFGANG